MQAIDASRVALNIENSYGPGYQTSWRPTPRNMFLSKKRAPAARLMAEKHEKTPKSSRNGHSMDATGWESIPRSQKMVADSISDVPEA